MRARRHRPWSEHPALTMTIARATWRRVSMASLELVRARGGDHVRAAVGPLPHQIATDWPDLGLSLSRAIGPRFGIHSITHNPPTPLCRAPKDWQNNIKFAAKVKFLHAQILFRLFQMHGRFPPLHRGRHLGKRRKIKASRQIAGFFN